MTDRVGAGKLRPVLSVGRAFSGRSSWALWGVILWVCLVASRASAQMHGYVEPCSPFFIEDSHTICEECPFDHSNLKSCAEGPGTRGFTFKCRTRGHSAPMEVWCKPRAREVPRELVLGGVVAGVALFAAGFLWWKRRSAA